MIIGILETDVLDKNIREIHGSYPDMFKTLLQSADKNILFQTYQVINLEYPQTIDDCDAYLITGSKFCAYDNELWINRLKEYVVELVGHQKKLIGICFGHQIIAQALDGQVERSEKGWGVGLYSSHVQNSKSWMQPVRDDFSLLVSHQDQVVKLPAQAELLASNDFCPNSGFTISNHVLTFQGHPEFNSEYLKYIMNKRRNVIGDEKYISAMCSLKNLVDSNVIAKWIVKYIKQEI